GSYGTSFGGIAGRIDDRPVSCRISVDIGIQTALSCDQFRGLIGVGPGESPVSDQVFGKPAGGVLHPRGFICPTECQTMSPVESGTGLIPAKIHKVLFAARR